MLDEIFWTTIVALTNLSRFVDPTSVPTFPENRMAAIVVTNP